MRELTIDTWSRRDHFYFYSCFDESFRGVTLEVDCTNAYRHAKENVASFYSLPLQIASCGQPYGSFGFNYMGFDEEFPIFERRAKKVIEKVRNTTDPVPATASENVIHYSFFPKPTLRLYRMQEISQGRTVSLKFPSGNSREKMKKNRAGIYSCAS